MNYSTDNTRIIDRRKVPAPYELVNKYPINDEISKLVYGTRNEISQILHNKDDRLFVVVGPCSIHDHNVLRNIFYSLFTTLRTKHYYIMYHYYFIILWSSSCCKRFSC